MHTEISILTRIGVCDSTSAVFCFVEDRAAGGVARVTRLGITTCGVRVEGTLPVGGVAANGVSSARGTTNARGV